MCSEDAQVQVAAFDSSRVLPVAPVAATMRSRPAGVACASVLKPLYVHAAANHARLSLPERSAIVTSSNTATDAVVAAAGGLAELLSEMRVQAGVELEPASSWGRVLVTADQVAQGYRSLLGDTTDRGRSVRAYMRRVRRSQQLGTRTVWATRRQVAVDEVGVRCGWDLTADGVLLTHAVVLDERAGAVVLTSRRVSRDVADRWRQALLETGPSGRVLVMHTITSGPALFSGLRHAAEELSC